MTPDQFKAWFEGFCDPIGDAPSPEQWAKIKAKIETIVAFPPQPRPADIRQQYGAAVGQIARNDLNRVPSGNALAGSILS